MPEQAPAVNTTVTADAANAGAWHASLDADTKGWVSGMGLDKLPADQALAKVLPMYRGAEQKLGVPADQVLRLPGKDAKPEDWNPVWSRLGAPEKPEDYGIAAPQGDTGEFLKTASNWFHELRMPKQMAAGLAAKWNEHVQGVQAKATEDWNKRFDTEVAELRGEWKGDYDKNLDLSNRVLRAAGFSVEQQTALESALGPKAFRQAFVKFASLIGEHRFVGGENNTQQFAMSAEQAKARIGELQKDTAWVAKYTAGDAEAKAEFTRLNQIAYPEPIAA